MSQQKEPVGSTVEQGNTVSQPPKKKLTSKRVTDHLANERTFLAWMRTGLATITFGFVIERFALLVRELGLKGRFVLSLHASSLVGIGLTGLGIVMMVAALLNFLQIRRAIDREEFQPRIGFAIVLTAVATLIGVILVVYLLSTQ
ncbi:MAG: DUF202 domain-containing protein [Chloroflexi bacterium]|nr:MAG: DUF202 domain-containing protein [Chloroflexota bacterium]